MMTIAKASDSPTVRLVVKRAPIKNQISMSGIIRFQN
jgi:hypothetical protein